MSLQFSYIDNIENNNINKNSKNLEKVKHFLKEEQTVSSFGEQDESALANFEPYQEKKVSPIETKRKKRVIEQFESQDLPIENTTQLSNNAYSQEYYKQFTAPSMPMPSKSQDDLLDKLNYMIHLLEHQKQQKSEDVMEELILYLFLGIFIIYILDSFTKIGKYVR